MAFPDPWERVPDDRRFDYAWIAKPLDDLTNATELGVERQLPPSIAAVPGAREVLLLLTKLARGNFDTIRSFCADLPPDPERKLSYSSSAPPFSEP